MKILKNISTLMLISLLALHFFSCEKEKGTEYRVDAEFEPYVQKFIDEGSKRGQSFDFHESGLIIEFATLEDNVFGRCHYEDPIRIEINEKKWTSLKKEPNGDLLKEKTMFHEIGHGILDRRHLNDLLPNGDWKTIMRGGTEINGARSNNVNYRGFRYDYYLDELFDVNTSAPDWSLIQPEFYDDPNENIIFSDEFDDDTDYWALGTTENRIAYLENGYYHYQVTRDFGFFQAKDFGLDTDEDFYIELNVKLQTDIEENDCGIVWAGKSGDNLYYFNFNKKGNVFIGTYYNYGWYIELIGVGIKPDEFNKLSIRKVDDIFYFSINDNFIYHTDHDRLFGNLAGFRTDGNSEIIVDKFFVSYLGTPAKSGHIISNELKTFYEGTTRNIKNEK